MVTNIKIFPARRVARKVRVWRTTTEDDNLGLGCLDQNALEIPSEEETTETVEGREEYNFYSGGANKASHTPAPS